MKHSAWTRKLACILAACLFFLCLPTVESESFYSDWTKVEVEEAEYDAAGSVTIQKHWSHKDGTSTWPTGQEVTMTLYSVDGDTKTVVTGIENPVKLTADKTSHTWENLDSATEYVVVETAVAGYTAYAAQADGSTRQSNEAVPVEGVASITNRQNEGGDVAIQITKYLVDGAGNLITPMTDSENTFYIYKNADATADSVKNVNRTAYSSFSVAGYGTESKDNAVATAKVTVGSSGWALVYDNTLSGGMYTIVEDKDSISDEIIDSTGAVWKYKQTEMRTEYAWRTAGDENGRHYGGVSTKTSGNYTAVPEVAGAYTGEDGSSLYNGFLDFFVFNVYERSQQTVTSEKINLQINKQWNDNGNTTPPTSGSATFRIHQVKTSVTTSESGGGNTGSIEVVFADKNGTTICSTTCEENASLVLHYQYKNGYQYFNLLKNGSYIGNYGSGGDGKGSYSYTVNSSDVVNGKITFSFDGQTITSYNPDGCYWEGGLGSGPSTTTTTEIDPAGSGFPKDVTITASDWAATETGLLAKVVNGNTTVTYSYYLEEVQRTGAAAGYTLASFSTGSSRDNAVTGNGGETKTITATNTKSSSTNIKTVALDKVWKDQNGNTLKEHPTEVLVDVYRIKLPTVGAGDGSITFNSIGGLYDVIGYPDTWQDNNNKILNDVVFQLDGNYYYVRVGQSEFSRSQLQAWENEIKNGYLNGAHVTKLTGKVWTLEEVENNGFGQTITRGDLCYYDGDYYVFRNASGRLDETGHTHGPAKDSGSWSKVGTGNILDGVSISLHPNENELSEDAIRQAMDTNVYKYIQDELIKKGSSITFTKEEFPLTLYQQNIKISEIDNWETEYSAQNGYLYFFFEHAIPGYTTTYAYEDYGITDKDQNVQIINRRPVGELDVTKEWTGDNSADKVYAKIYRNNVDITAELAEKASLYGLTASDFLNGTYLVISKSGSTWGTLQITGLPLAKYAAGEDDTPYLYSIQEMGYQENDVNHWGVSDVLSGYESSQQGGAAQTTTGSTSNGVELGNTASSITIKNSTSSEPTSAEVDIVGRKVLEHKALEANAFTFLLYKSDATGSAGAQLGSASNEADGTFSFTTTISYAEYQDAQVNGTATFYYLVKEDVPEGGVLDGITYDQQTYLVKVTVREQGGSLTVTSQELVQPTQSYLARK